MLCYVETLTHQVTVKGEVPGVAKACSHIFGEVEEGEKAEVDAKGGLEIEPTEKDQSKAVGSEGVQSLGVI